MTTKKLIELIQTADPNGTRKVWSDIMKQSDAYELLLEYVRNLAFYGDSGDQRSGAQEILDQIEGNDNEIKEIAYNNQEFDRDRT